MNRLSFLAKHSKERKKNEKRNQVDLFQVARITFAFLFLSSSSDTERERDKDRQTDRERETKRNIVFSFLRRSFFFFE